MCARVAVGGCCPSISVPGRRSTAGSANWPGAFLFQTIYDIELMLDRERQGREQSSSAVVIDSQSDTLIYRSQIGVISDSITGCDGGNVSEQRGFFDLDERYAAFSAAGDPLEKLGGLIDFEIFRPALDAVLQRSDGSRGGRPLMDAVMMFKAQCCRRSTACPAPRPSCICGRLPLARPEATIRSDRLRSYVRPFSYAHAWTSAKMVSAAQVPNRLTTRNGHWNSRGIVRLGSIDRTICSFLASSRISSGR